MRVVWLAVLFGVVMVSGAVRAGQAPLRLVLGDKTERPFWHAGTHRFGTEKFVFGFLAEPFDSSSAVAVRDRKIDRVLAPDGKRAKLSRQAIVPAAADLIEPLRPVVLTTTSWGHGYDSAVAFGSNVRPSGADGISLRDWSNGERLYVPMSDFDAALTLVNGEWRAESRAAYLWRIRGANPPAEQAMLRIPDEHRHVGTVVLGVGALVAGGCGLYATGMEPEDWRTARDLNRVAWGTLIAAGFFALVSR